MSVFLKAKIQLTKSKLSIFTTPPLQINYQYFNSYSKLNPVTLRENKVMKNFAIKLVWFTTAYVFIFAGLNQTDISLRIIIGMHIIGVFLIPFMVYTVLTDNYTTTKTFKDWYEDHEIKTLDNEETD
ncbi:hypothetical protein SLW70_06585 [Flavobacterium sp. NG2]|uniref:hypothetical protein n=1 Tax=Flavobacterium sp. NG2 TaxID=3097547 RepID=UPI002A8209E8|nr:hypothetical protein [Flavobacterium sp. NG2]WPR72788.1 hypothetical protein SLW70_06585 [Flavobacterium sp. NG2]